MPFHRWVWLRVSAGHGDRTPVLCHPTDGCGLGSVLAWGTGRVNSAVAVRLGPEVSSSVDFNILSVAQGRRVGNKDRRQSTHIEDSSQMENYAPVRLAKTGTR